MATGSVLVVSIFALGGLAAIVCHVLRRRLREARTVAKLTRRFSDAAPRSFHPIVDPDRCIGSLACLDACPEGEVLSIRDGIPVLLHPEKCVGHGVCADECPVGAIRLVVGSRERAVILPELRGTLEASRPGVYVVGELAGAPLLEPSIRQGLRVGALLASTVSVGDSRDPIDVAIVGAGPAGLATAFALESAGVPYRVLERGSALSTIRSYPTGKMVTTRPVDLPGAGFLTATRISREELLERWIRALERREIRVDEQTEVLGIDGGDGDFTLRTSRGPVQARKVVLAAGRSGTPRRLGVPGEDLTKVTRQLGDAAAYRGRSVLVVGGGDSAAEAVVALARAGASEVVLCHRGDDLGRCRSSNQAAVDELAARGDVRVLLRSRVARIDPTTVSLITPAGGLTLRNDAVLLAIGGDLPLGLLQAAGVRVRRYAGEAPEVGGAARGEREALMRRAVLPLAATLGAVAFFVGLQSGWDYYRLDRVARLHSPLHPVLRASSRFGTAMGVLTAVLMAIVLAYSIRKRSRELLGFGSMRAWLDAHVVAGMLSLLAVALHAGFSTTSAVASATRAAMIGLLGTGVVGRYVYGRIGGGAAQCRSEVRGGVPVLEASGSTLGTIEAVVEAAPAAAVALKGVLAGWRPLHLALAAFVAVAVAAHLVVVGLLGYAFR